MNAWRRFVRLALTMVFFAVVMLLSLPVGMAQDSPCPGLKNPTNFSLHSAYKGQLGTKIYQACDPATGVTGMTFDAPVYNNSQLAALVSATWWCNEPHFRIRTQADSNTLDTDNQLPYVPDGFTSSIQLGNSCSGISKAEALYYYMTVTPDNYLLSLYYAIVVQSPGHGPTGDPTFVIRITRDTSSIPSENYIVNQIFGDSSSYMIASCDVQDGVDGWHRVGLNDYNILYYRDWHRASINLYDYMYSRIRIELMVSNCFASAHYGYALFAGDCQKLDLVTSYCEANDSAAVAVVKAPRGMASYQWYAARGGVTNSSNINDFNLLTGRTDSTLYLYAGDFAGNDTTYAERTFLCRLSSSMNPAHPFFFQRTITVHNIVPTLWLDSLFSCSGLVYLNANSFISAGDIYGGYNVNTALTRWRVYDTVSEPDSLVLDTVAPSLYCQLPAGLHNVTVNTYGQDSLCWNEKTFAVDVLGVPQTHISIAPCRYVYNDSIPVVDDTPDPARPGHYTTWRKWVVHHATHTDTLVRTGSSLGDRTLYIVGDSPVMRIELWNRTERFVLRNDYINGTEDRNYCMGYAVDSVVLSEPYVHYQYDTLCSTAAYTAHGFDIAGPQDGDTLLRHAVDVLGCDSVVAVVLTVYPAFEEIVDDAVCFGDDYEGHGFTLHDVSANDTLSILNTTIHGCDSNVVLQLKVVPDPVLSATVEDFECSTRLFHLSATHTADVPHVVWMQGDSVLAEADDLYLSTSAPANVVATATVPLVHCQNSIQVDVPATPVFKARMDAHPPVATQNNTEIVLVDQSVGFITGREWLVDEESGRHDMPGSPLCKPIGDAARQMYNFPVGYDSVSVLLVVTENHYRCSDTAALVIPFVGGAIWVPNAFTPQLTTNNVFRVQGSDIVTFQMVVYDRNGTEVYRGSDIDEGWDGTFRPHGAAAAHDALQPGTVCPQGAYAYIIYYAIKATPHQINKKVGTVLLLR